MLRQQMMAPLRSQQHQNETDKRAKTTKIEATLLPRGNEQHPGYVTIDVADLPVSSPVPPAIGQHDERQKPPHFDTTQNSEAVAFRTP